MKSEDHNLTTDNAEVIGVLITNLGTPDEPTRPALYRYLKQFLWDARVVEVPRVIWWFILNLVILVIRPPRAAKAYQEVWGTRGSPLRWITEDQQQALAKSFKNSPVQIEYAMRYGSPSIGDTLQRFQEKGIDKVLVLPLYPQYSGSTTGSTSDEIARFQLRQRKISDIQIVREYFHQPVFITACATQLKRHLNNLPADHKVLFSYHGIPQSYVDKGDPYAEQCFATSKLIANELQLTESQYETVFQSRFGAQPWLTPYLDKYLQAAPGQGINSVSVFCPGFAADCLETLEEVAIENRDYFIEAGGSQFTYIPALNDSAEHINALKHIIECRLKAWGE